MCLQSWNTTSEQKEVMLIMFGTPPSADMEISFQSVAMLRTVYRKMDMHILDYTDETSK